MEHDHALQVCARIREGLKRNIDKARIREYIDWFEKTYVEPHFKFEEQLVFPLLGNNARVRKAMANHRRIKRLLGCSCEDERVLNLLEEELSTYVRYEERVLYNEIQVVATPRKLAEIEKHHHTIAFSDDGWTDRFWLA